MSDRSVLVRKFLVVPLILLVYLLAGGPTASAHSGKQSYVYVSLYDAGLDGRVELQIADLGPVLGVDFGTEVDQIEAVTEANTDAVIAYLDDHFAISSIDGVTLTIEYDDDIRVLDRGPQSYLLIDYDVLEEFDDPPREFVVEFDAIIEANPERDALLHIENDVRSGILENESDAFLGFSTGQTVQTVSVETVSTFTQIGAVRGAGTDAIRGGAVHAVFLVVLLTPIALLARGRGFGDPAPTNAAVVGRTAAVLGVFAAGHLATLWLTGLGVIDLSSRAVVALTSASLLAVAGWAFALWLRPSVASAEYAVVGVLGLIQGLGLGLQFADDGLDRSRTLVSLIGYTIGVEVAVVILAVLVVVPLAILRRTPIAPVLLGVVAAIGAAYALAWIFEGLFDADWELYRIENPWRVWPRNLVVAAVVTLAAVGIRAIFDARGSLRPVGDDTPADGESAPSPEPVMSR